MEKISLRKLFAESLFRVPDYQRGYAWELKQWNDFIEDIDALVDNEVTSHYTGTIVTYRDRKAPPSSYGTQQIAVSDVVDGQQRLTTTCLFLSIVIRKLTTRGYADYGAEIPNFLYSGAVCRLTLANSTASLYRDLLKNGYPQTDSESVHGRRLTQACLHFQKHIDAQVVAKGDSADTYLKNLFDAVTRKLAFTFYTLEEECEIGMTFELMNSRGKDLSVLELLKNYLMHWIARNAPALERTQLTSVVNESWKKVYANVSRADGDEDQCLRVTWTLLLNHTPANWKGYAGFKSDEYIPLRKIDSREHVQSILVSFTEGLAEISKFYADIVEPSPKAELFAEETAYLTKLQNAGNTANFLPLLVAARRKAQEGKIKHSDYLDLLRALEIYSYRVFLYTRRRSNAGKSNFYRWGSELWRDKITAPQITGWVHGLTRYYAPEKEFLTGNAEPDDWYSVRHLLRYTLYEHELHLLATKGKGKAPHLRWEHLSDSSIEHVLPQNPEKDSRWLEDWSEADIKQCLHDIGNLVLTQNNSNYRNFEFDRKKGLPGNGFSYSNSDIRQERELAAYSTWTRADFDQRRRSLVEWINKRWATVGAEDDVPSEAINEDDDAEPSTV